MTQSADGGTIRAREAHQVVRDLMEARRVPRGVWSITPRGKLSILVGSRQVQFDCPSGMSFYGLKALCETLDRVLTERERAAERRGQIDIEEAIAAVSP